MESLGYRRILWIHRRVIEETGGSHGVRDEGLLRSALARPHASFGGHDLYPTVFEKAAALLEFLVRNHPFIDGNKRVAWEVMDLLLDLNGYRLDCTTQQGFDLMMQIIAHQVTVEEIAQWLSKRSHPHHPKKDA